MKKLFLFVAAVAMSIAASATDIWTGSKHVTWGQGLQIAADQFAAAQPGNLLKVHFTGATDGIEFKVMNADTVHLAGSRESAWISGDGAFEQFLTQTAVDSLKAYGLEIIGANFTATQVELLESKTPKDGYTVWTGFFWVDDAGGWKTLELYRNGYAGVDWSKVTAVRFYTEAKGPDYIINFLKSWDDGGKFADQTKMTDGEGYKELVLTDSLRTVIAEAGHWMIQFSHKNLGKFNATDVVLVINDSPTAIEQTNTDAKAIKSFRNGMLVIEKNGKFYNALGAEVK